MEEGMSRFNMDGLFKWTLNFLGGILLLLSIPGKDTHCALLGIGLLISGLYFKEASDARP
jgi:hypothetical protein